MAAWDPHANDLFLNALEITSPVERAAYIEKACGADAPLRKVVEGLLQSHQSAGSILEPMRGSAGPAVSTTADPPGEAAGAIIGNYKLLNLLGEGGFGSVFMAEQQRPVRRRVAMKIIKLGMDTKQVIARFEAERQALAMMDHPNIAKVLDAGATGAGRPFFVMELVKGVPITKYCDVNELSTNDRLELFHAVCLAVQHAHQKGIIHRDLKPGNILVMLRDDKPVPKVIDFGIAKATSARLTDMTLHTELNQMIGTPQYMSPEQAEMSALDVDTRTDIYSLGVLLYELLIGATPLDANTLRAQPLADMQRMIRETDSPRPSVKLASLGAMGVKIASQRRTDVTRLGRQLRGELDWIVLKATEKDRIRRYETAQGLALDVRRYLDDEPVLARPPSALYRVRKFVRKHKVSVTAASLVALALVAGIAGTSVGMIRAGRSERVVTEQKNRAVGLLDAVKAAEGKAELAKTLAEKSAAAAISAKRQADINHARGRITEGNALGASGDWDSARIAFAGARTELKELGLSPRVAEFAMWDSYRNLPPPLAIKSLGDKPIVGVEWLPDGRSAIALAEDGVITIWDVPTGQTQRQFRDKAARHSCQSMALSPDGSNLITVRGEKTLVVWDVASGAILKELPQTANILRAIFSRDGKQIIAGGKKWGKIVAFPGCQTLFEHDPAKSTYKGEAHFLPLATAPSPFVRSWYGGVNLWDVQADTSLNEARGPVLAYSAVASSPDGAFVVLGDHSGALRRWDFRETRQIEFSSKHESEVRSIVFTAPDRLLSVDVEGWICEWAPSTRTLLRRVGKASARSDHAISAQPNGRTVLLTEVDGSVSLWSLGPSRESASFPCRKPGSDETPTAAAVLPDNRTAVIGTEHGLVDFWDMPTGQWLSTEHQDEARDGTGKSQMIQGLFPIADGKVLCAFGKPNIQGLCHWDARTYRRLGESVEFKGDQRLTALRLSGDGRFAIGLDMQGALHAWDALTFAERPTDPGILGGTPSDLIRQMKHEETFLRLSTPTPGISLIHNQGEMTLRLQDSATGEELRKLVHPANVGTAACSGDQRWLVVGDDSRQATFWDIGSLSDDESFATRLAAARKALDANPKNPEAMRTLGEWYAFRGEPLWSAECLAAAASQGAKISRLMLARCHWSLNNFDAAEREFNAALANNEAPTDYLQRCIGRVRQQSAQTEPWREKVGAAAKAGHPIPALEELLRQKPYDPELLGALGHAHGSDGQFVQATADFDRALEIHEDTDWIFQRGCLRLYAGNQQGYHDDCNLMYELHLRGRDATRSNQACKLCLLQAGAVSDVSEVAAAIDEQIKAGGTERRQDWDALNMGMAEYRQGHFDAAIPWLEKAGASSIPPAAIITAQLFQAMSNYRADRSEKGKDQLRACINRMETELSKDGRGEKAGFENWLICQIVRREAEALIR